MTDKSGMPSSQPSAVPPMSRRAMLITFATALVVILCVGGVFLFGGLGLVSLFSEPPLEVKALTPPPVSVGAAYEITLSITNTHDRPVKVTEIQLPFTILEGSDVESSSPAFTAQTDYSGRYGYSFSIDLDPGQSQTIVFKMNALYPGDFTGEARILSGTRAKPVALRVKVDPVAALPEPSPTPTPEPTLEPTATPAAVLPTVPSIGAIPYQAVVQVITEVRINGKTEPGWTGSGSIISPDGLILTNAHVILSDGNFEVEGLIVALTVAQDSPPEPAYRMEILQVDEAMDIAIGRIATDLDGNPVDPATLNLPTVALGDSDDLQLGDTLIILGYPGIGGDTITLTRGEVSGFSSDSEHGNRAFIKTSATIAGGNSGGLAANASGELIGVPTQLGYGGEDQYVDCRVLADTNRDGVVDDEDNCVPTGGFINALRPIKLVLPYIDAARRGESNVSMSAPTTGFSRIRGPFKPAEENLS